MTVTQPASPAPVAAGRFVVKAIAPDVLDELRVRDDAGDPPRLVTDSDGGSPLRCCLRPSRPGETLALVSYAPLRRWARQTGADPGPYAELGPVFIHPRPCAGPAGDGWPEWLTGAPRVLRGYDARGRIHCGQLVTAAQVSTPGRAAGVLAAMFADPAVALLHARAVEYGCFTFEIRRAG